MKKQGFTLLELSIVLVIIGLLIGGIFVGQSLIHTAQLNAVVSEFNRYQTATQNFKQQYQALPGDISNATSFWGSAGGTGADATCQNTAATTAATCNGNANGVIGTSAVGDDETFRFWQHLANAKMIEGSYSGVSGIVGGVNYPASRYTSNTTNWHVTAASMLAGGSSIVFNADYGIGHVFCLDFACSNGGPGSGMPPKDAWSLDKKIDDGKPALGNLVSTWSTCTDAGSYNTLTANYVLTDRNPDCGLYFISSF